MLSGKAQVSQESLKFDVRKYESQVEIEGKGVDLEEKKFLHLVKLEKKKCEHGLKLGGKKLKHGIKSKKSKLDWEKEEKEKDWAFEPSKLETLADKEKIGKKYELVTQCVASGKSTNEIERLEKLFN